MDRHPYSNQHPHYCYRHTARHLPIRQERLLTENGNRVATASSVEEPSGYQSRTPQMPGESREPGPLKFVPVQQQRQIPQGFGNPSQVQ